MNFSNQLLKWNLEVQECCSIASQGSLTTVSDNEQFCTEWSVKHDW